MKKKVILLIVDALAGRLVEQGIETGQLPNLKRLMDAGWGRFDCCSIFPSITHAALPSLMTGKYPSQHGIYGTYWYSADEDEIIYYGGDFNLIIKQGVGKFFENFCSKFNDNHLKAPTLFEMVEGQGLRAANINHLIFRGNSMHELSKPLLMKLLPGPKLPDCLPGPSIMYLGDIVQAEPPGVEAAKDAPGGPTNRFGIQDRTSAYILINLAKQNALPDFTVAYFPDNDGDSHDHGPEGAFNTVRGFDSALGQFFEALGGLEQALEDHVIIVTGDHSQSNVGEGEEAEVDLSELLPFVHLSELGATCIEDGSLLATPNMRAAILYLDQCSSAEESSVVEALLRDPRIDQVLCSGCGEGDGRSGFRVTTSDRGDLTVWLDESGTPDEYGNRWRWTGSLEAIDARVEDQVIRYGIYPNALERIACCLLGEGAGSTWVTARLGCELKIPGRTLHTGGGSHSSLHELDSLVPLIVAGSSADKPLAPPRIVDVAPLCLAELGLQSEVAPDARACARSKIQTPVSR